MAGRRLFRTFSMLLLLVALAPFASARAAADAQSVVADFGSSALGMLGDSRVSLAERQKRFHDLLDRDFDFQQVARFVLGRYWQSASDDQRKRFAQVFEDYVVLSYSKRFDDFTGTSFKVTGERSEGAASTIVRTDILRRNGGQPAKVDWRVSKVGDDYKITEVTVDGISMSLTHRQEFAAVMERNGGDIADLITQIQQRTAGAEKQ